MNNKRIQALDDVRLTCTAGIVLFHFLTAAGEYAPVAARIRVDGRIGFILVTCFFVLSGVVLQLRYGPTGSDMISFYRKRVLTIYPPFYLSFLVVWIATALKKGNLFYRKIRWTFLLTILGLDGYFSSALQTCYLVGEWFLGAILLLYFLYPLLRLCLSKSLPLTCMIVCTAFWVTRNQTLFAVSPLANIFSCMVSFLFGMVLAQGGWLQGKRYLQLTGMLTAAVLILGIWFRPFESSSWLHTVGFAFFLLLYGLFDRCNWKMPAYPACYEVFLVHHVIIDRMLRFFPAGSCPILCLQFLLCMVLTVLSAGILHGICQTARKLFIRLS